MPFQDKEMGSDVLDMLKHQCVGLTKAAIECSNADLRNTLMQMRQFCEAAQWEMYRLAEQKGWYLPASPAEHQQIQRVRQYLQGAPVTTGITYGRDGGTLH